MKQDIKTPFGPIGEFVFKRTYARRILDDYEDTESFHMTIMRVLTAARDQLKVPDLKDPEYFDKAYKMLKELKGSVAGRFLWQLGTTTVDRLGLLSLQNCAFTVVSDPIRPFTWAFDALMLGSGVGFNIQLKHVYSLPPVLKEVQITHKETKDADFIVPDSREGWISLLDRVLKSFFITGKSFSYSTVLVRGAGELIKGFGGTASGPGPLIKGIKQIAKLLSGKGGKKISPVDALDIMNIIGSVVVAGNVRRSAQIALGDSIDKNFLYAKRWDLGNIPSYRAMSNNSVVVNDIDDLPDYFWEGYLGNGEPYGMINLPLSRAVGRLGETQYPDPDVEGYNPCAEQSLANYETCCLAEIFLPNNKTKEELWDIVELLYKINKHSLALPCHLKETEEIVHKNMRMGIGITGYLQASKEQKSWLDETYKKLRELDNEYSDKHGFSRSIKLTTVKPSGTLSLLAGVTPGVHPGYSQYHIRRVRLRTDDPLVEQARKSGYPVEFVRSFDGAEDKETSIISFPCSFPEGTVIAKDVSAVDQLNYVKELQTVWSDNSVSCTVYYKKEELPEIKEWLRKNYKDSVKSVSFLLHSGHGFDQAPLEEITKEEYERLSAKVRPIDFDGVNHELDSSLECGSGGCPII
jgi:adenosylcobalamin-dependent ribonucleoside-triphosphate reductase